MGTTLTGTTPQDTYDSLIKVTDNGPLSGSLKKLTDGLGNDSSLSLSTTAASFSGTLAVSGASTFSGAVTMALGGTPRLTLQDTDGGAGNVGILFKESTSDKWTLASNGGNFQFFNEATASNALFISSTNNVGIGTSSPSTKLTIDNSSSATTRAIDLVGNASTAKGHLGYFADNVYLSSNYFFDSGQNYDVSGLGQALVVVSASATNSNIQFATSAAGSTAPTIRATIDADGLKFGSDTAAANALDDYEEGTFTPTTATSGYTISTSSGVYTKIGRQVTINCSFSFSAVDASSTSAVTIGGLPFTSGSFQSSGSCRESDVLGAIYAAASLTGTTNVFVNSMDGVTTGSQRIFATGDRYVLTLTYFV